MTAPPDCADIAEASAAGKWLAAAAIAAAAVLALVFRQYVWPVFEAASIAAPDAAAVSRVRIAAAGLAAVGVACAAYLLHYGRAVLASGRNPPLAARLWRATRIVRGRTARGQGWSYVVCGAVALVACLGLLAYLHGVLAELPLLDTGDTAAPAGAGAAAIPE